MFIFKSFFLTKRKEKKLCINRERFSFDEGSFNIVIAKHKITKKMKSLSFFFSLSQSLSVTVSIQSEFSINLMFIFGNRTF